MPRLAKKIQASLHSRCHADPCNEWRGSSAQLSSEPTQLRRSIAAVGNTVWIGPARESNSRPPVPSAVGLTTTPTGGYDFY